MHHSKFEPNYSSDQTNSNILELSVKSRDKGMRMVSFSIIGHQTRNWEMKIKKNEITGTQTIFSSNFGGKLELHPVFPFP